MKYSCQSCSTCCISPSSQVSYCGTLTQCHPSNLPYAQAVGCTILTIFLLTAVLSFLYFTFKDRQIGIDQPNQQQYIKDELNEKPQTRVQKEIVNKKNNKKSFRENAQLSANSKIGKKPKGKNKQSKSVNKVTAQTQRGLRIVAK